MVAVEPEPLLRREAERAAAAAPVPIRLVDGLADALPLDDHAVDAGVASLVLCSVPDPSAALAELHRVIRPGGELRFYEHVQADRPLPARLQRVADLVWPHIAGGCHLSRDTTTALEAARFRIDHIRRFSFRPMPSAPPTPHILGSARRPEIAPTVAGS